MADMQITPGKGRKGSRSNKLSTRVDLTPMVDLGFLLLTFFVFTTTISDPVGVKLNLPADGPPTQTVHDKTINLVLAEHNRVFYYVGDEVGNLKCTNFSADGVRTVILNMKNQVFTRYGSEAGTVILIRPTALATFENIIDILDEIYITGITRYVLMEEERDPVLLGLIGQRRC